MEFDTSHNQIIHFDDMGFPVQAVTHTLLRPGDAELATPVRHAELEIKYFVAGTAVVEIGSRSMLCSAGDVVICNPLQPHCTRVFSGQSEYHLLILSPTLLRGLQGDRSDRKYLIPFLEGRIRFTNLIRGNKPLTELLRQVFVELQEQREAYELAVKGLLQTLLARLLRDCVESVRTDAELLTEKKYAQLLSPALLHIASHYREDVRLELLAGLCGISKKYFCRVFRALTGMTAMEYLNNCRIAQAEILLRGTSERICDVAQAVGIGDCCYFSRLFRRLRGCAPSAVR